MRLRCTNGHEWAQVDPDLPRTCKRDDCLGIVPEVSI